MVDSLSDPRALAREVLLAALDPDAGHLGRFGHIDWATLPWDWLLARARWHKALALLIGRLDGHGFEKELPDSVREEVQKARVEISRKATAAVITLEEVVRICRSRSIPFVVLKGSVLAETIYGDPNLRVFSDVDVMVPGNRVDELGEELRAREYYFYAPASLRRYVERRDRKGAGSWDSELSTAEAQRLLRKHHHHFSYGPREEDPRIPVEVHWHIAPPKWLRIPPRDVWRQCTEATVAGNAVTILNFEAALLHAALHAMAGPPTAGFRLLHLCDVAWIVQRAGHRLRPDVLQQLATDWRLERYLTCALEAADAIFPFPVTRSETYRPHRSVWSRTCLRLAEMDPSIVDERLPDTRVDRVAKRLFREAFWDFAFLRPPRRAFQTLTRAKARVASAIGRVSSGGRPGAKR
ncbi:MAG: nucleotidyltransferase family protein [Gemmatimonadota bacterium]|nr:MAG: nucleotidyltransferase family protein [Gemmatimonadota bacterium]